MGQLSKLPNIGEEVERQLNEIGIYEEKELKEVGSRKAWLEIQAKDPSACIHRLMALEGAIQGILKKDLTEEDKKDLKTFYQQHKL